MSALQITWFLLIGVLLTIFAILDGFDLGVGFWHLWTKKDRDRRVLLNAVGPVWDGNEVWLLTGGGALFAAFPPVYATVFSGFYLAMILVIFALILRAVSGEFRSKEESPAWRNSWDTTFSIGSILASLLFGVALGNILRGIPMDINGNFAGTFWTLLNPFALLIGIVGLSMIAFHGALYIVLKAKGDLESHARKWAISSGIIYLILFIISGIFTLATQSHLLTNYFAFPAFWIVPLLVLTFIILALIFTKKERAGKAFLFSCLSIASSMGVVGIDLFPRLVPALGNPERSLTAENASSSEMALKAMLIITIIGLPFVIGYTIWVYKAFKGKVDIDAEYNHY